MKKIKILSIIMLAVVIFQLCKSVPWVIPFIIFAIIVIVLWITGSQSDTDTNDTHSLTSRSGPDKTFSFALTGTRYPCKFPSRYSERQTAISHSHVGDVVILKEFEWEGEAAFAVVNKRSRTDIGVVPKKLLSKVMALVSGYDITGKIAAINTVEIKGESCKTCDIILDCYKNDALSTKDAPIMASTAEKTHRFNQVH